MGDNECFALAQGRVVQQRKNKTSTGQPRMCELKLASSESNMMSCNSHVLICATSFEVHCCESDMVSPTRLA